MQNDKQPILSIIIPTWNNPEFLNPCIQSIVDTGVTQTGFGELIIVNNGKQPIENLVKNFVNVKLINCPDNLGWEGGLKEGLKHSKSPFVVFQNDDTFLPKISYLFYERLLIPFQDKNVSIVAPCTTVAAGIQSIYNPYSPKISMHLNWAIFFTVMVRRSDLDAVGGIDDALPGGDDFDLSIRMRQAGKKIVFNPDAFIIHHGFKTGVRVKGDHTVSGGWNSIQMSDRTNQALIRKHGFKTFFSTVTQQVVVCNEQTVQVDAEGDLIRSLLFGGENILEVACGFRKTVENSIGVDRVKKGSIIPIYHGERSESVADFCCDVTDPLPMDDNCFDVIIARHILEHCIDTVQTLKNWSKVLKVGGRLIIAVPDESIINGIPLSPDHCHAFNNSSLKNLVESIGFEQSFSKSCENGISFVSVFEKVNIESKQPLELCDA